MRTLRRRKDHHHNSITFLWYLVHALTVCSCNSTSSSSSWYQAAPMKKRAATTMSTPSTNLICYNYLLLLLNSSTGRNYYLLDSFRRAKLVTKCLAGALSSSQSTSVNTIHVHHALLPSRFYDEPYCDRKCWCRNLLFTKKKGLQPIRISAVMKMFSSSSASWLWSAFCTFNKEATT